MIIKAPVISEKSVELIEDGRYVFFVEKDANKKEIAEELTKTYGVEVKNVRIVNLPAKKVNFKRRPGVRAHRHKAYVWLTGKKRLPGFEEYMPKEKTDKKEAVKEKDAKTS